MDKVTMSYLFSFSRCQAKYVLSSYLVYGVIFDQPLKQWLTWGKEGKTEIQKSEYLENEKSFLDDIKNIFHSF